MATKVRQWSSVYHPSVGWGTVRVVHDGVAIVEFDEDNGGHRYVPVSELTHVRDWQPVEPDEVR